MDWHPTQKSTNMPEKFFSKEKPQESESDSDKLVIDSGAQEKCEQPEKPQVSESDSNKFVINNDVQEKCEQPEKPQESVWLQKWWEVREWPKEYRDKWKLAMLWIKQQPADDQFKLIIDSKAYMNDQIANENEAKQNKNTGDMVQKNQETVMKGRWWATTKVTQFTNQILPNCSVSL